MVDKKSLYERGKTAASGELPHLLGQVVEFPDVNWSSTEPVKPALSGATVHCRWVMNDSGGALLPGQTVVYKTGYALQRIVDETATSGETPVGVVDEYLPSAGVANGECFWIVIEGPGKCLNEASGTCTEFVAVKAGTTTGGRVETNASTPGVTDVGWAMETTSTAGALFRVFIKLRQGG